MVPYGDMLNHGKERNVDYQYLPSKSGVTFRATRDIKRGEEICDSYGSTSSNETLFFCWGIVLPNHDLWNTFKVDY